MGHRCRLGSGPGWSDRKRAHRAEASGTGGSASNDLAGADPLVRVDEWDQKYIDTMCAPLQTASAWKGFWRSGRVRERTVLESMARKLHQSPGFPLWVGSYWAVSRHLCRNG